MVPELGHIDELHLDDGEEHPRAAACAGVALPHGRAARRVLGHAVALAEVRERGDLEEVRDVFAQRRGARCDPQVEHAPADRLVDLRE